MYFIYAFLLYKSVFTEKKTSLFDPYGCNCNSRNTKCAKGSSRSLRESKKSVRNAKSLGSKKVSRKTGCSESTLKIYVDLTISQSRMYIGCLNYFYVT